MNHHGAKYIVIEGIDGAGTTTQKELLKAVFIKRGIQTIDVAEPGGTPIGDALRIVIKNGLLRRSAETNLDLFTACRRELAQQVIKPALLRGAQVISDRNWFSSVAYQGFGEGIDISMIINKTEQAMDKMFLPTIAIIIDVPLQVSEGRIKKRDNLAQDTFEQKDRAFFEKVREGYLWVASKYEVPVIDGTQSIDEVHADIIDLVDKKFILRMSTIPTSAQRTPW